MKNLVSRLISRLLNFILFCFRPSNFILIIILTYVFMGYFCTCLECIYDIDLPSIDRNRSAAKGRIISTTWILYISKYRFLLWDQKPTLLYVTFCKLGLKSTLINNSLNPFIFIVESQLCSIFHFCKLGLKRIFKVRLLKRAINIFSYRELEVFII